jgi:hypothetical protein
MKQTLKITAALALTLALSACIAGSAESGHAASGGPLSEILLGFWHGLIAPLMLIGEVIDKFAPHLLPWQVRVYEVKATGALYDVGFYFGLLGGPGAVWGGWSRRNR